MSTITADTLVDLQSVRAARTGSQRPPHGTDLAARIFMACLALTFLSVAAFALRTSFAGGAPAPRPGLSRTYCTNMGWDTPFPYRNCFIVPAN